MQRVAPDGPASLGGRISLRSDASKPGYQLVGGQEDDVVGLQLRDHIGMRQIMFESDYPHGDSTWPHSKEVLEKVVDKAGLDETETHMLARGNAIRCYGLERFGIAA